MAGAAASQRTLRFDNGRGQTLVGDLVLASPSSSQPLGCVLLCHGYASNRNGFQLPALAAALAEAGFSSFRFDFAGNGESQGAFRLAGYHDEVRDIEAARAFISEQHSQRVVALLGHSKAGGNVILYAARHDGRIPLIINVAGRFHMAEGLTMRFGSDLFERIKRGPIDATATRDDGVSWTWQLTQEDLQDRLQLDMAAAAASITKSRVLTVHGSGDAVIPVSDGRDFAAAIPGSELVVVEGADHNFRGSPACKEALIGAAVAWLQREAARLPPAGSGGTA